MALEIYVYDEKLDLNAEAVIALTKQVADLKKLTVIRSDFTNTLTIPLTDNNRRILQNSQVVVSTTDIPYERIPVSVYQDGVQLITYGYGVIDEAGDTFKLVIYDGNIDWTTALGTLRLEDLDFTDAIHEWTLATIENAHQFPGNGLYCYPPVVTGQRDLTAVNFTQAFVPPYLFNVAFMRPYTYMKEVLFRIFDQIGYTLQGDILSDQRYQAAIVELSRFDWSKKWYRGRYYENTTTYLCQRAQTGSGVRYGYLRFQDETNDLATLSGLDCRLFSQKLSPVLNEPYTELSLFAGTFINSVKPGRYRIRLTLDLNVLGSVNVAGTLYGASSVQYVVESSVTMTMVQGFTNLFTNNTTTTIEFDIEADPFVAPARFWLRSTAPNPLAVIDNFQFNLLPGTRMEVVDFFGSGVFTYGNPVNIAYNLPDMTQVDYVKAMCNMFGVAPVGDAVDKTVKLVAWNDLDALKPLAVDWSSKLDTNKPAPIKPRLDGWARENDFNYAADPDGFVPVGFGDGEIMVADEWLPERRVAVQLPFSATQDNEQGFPFVYRCSEFYDITDPTRETHFTREGPARILMSRWTTGTTLQVAMPSTGVPIITIINNYQDAYFIETNRKGLDWEELLADYYPFVELFTNQPKQVTAELLLTPVDIQRFNPFVPVYISKFSSYFFVNKITNWVKGKTCKVELIRI